jgi:hypothetical protein
MPNGAAVPDPIALPPAIRTVKIPFNFPSIRSYCQTFLAAIYEEMQLGMLDLSGRFWNCQRSFQRRQEAAILGKGRSNGAGSKQSSTLAHGFGGMNRHTREKKKPPQCQCGPAKKKTVRAEGDNFGKHFFTCCKGKNRGCDFFEWDTSGRAGNSRSEGLSTAEHDKQTYFRSKRVSYYASVQLFRSKSKTGKSQKWKRKKQGSGSNWMGSRVDEYGGEEYDNDDDADEVTKPQLFLKFPEGSLEQSKNYAKGDVWILSTTGTFTGPSAATKSSRSRDRSSGAGIVDKDFVIVVQSMWHSVGSTSRMLLVDTIPPGDNSQLPALVSTVRSNTSTTAEGENQHRQPLLDS